MIKIGGFVALIRSIGRDRGGLKMKNIAVVLAIIFMTTPAYAALETTMGTVPNKTLADFQKDILAQSRSWHS